MSISVIFTGGTIGSQVNKEGYISTLQDDKKYLLLEKYAESYGEDDSAEFIIREPYRILSENLELLHISRLIDCIKAALSEDEPEGIIITHGTDTLQYTAGFLSAVFSSIDIPIVMVSSAYVLDDERSNGLANLRLAIDFIHAFNIGGIFVSYVNSDGRELIHCGNRLLEHNAFSADIYSIRDEWFARRDDTGCILLREPGLGSGKMSHSSEESSQNSEESSQNSEVSRDIFNASVEKAFFENDGKVLLLREYPGILYPEPDCFKAVLLVGYHSGTLNVNEALRAFCEKAKCCNVKIYLAGMSQSVTQYETVEVYDSLGIIPIYDMAPIAAYCMLTAGILPNK